MDIETDRVSELLALSVTLISNRQVCSTDGTPLITPDGCISNPAQSPPTALQV